MAQTHTTSSIIVGVSFTALSALPSYPYEQAYLPTQNTPIHYAGNHYVGRLESYSLPFEESATDLNLSETVRINELFYFARQVLDESLDVPSDIAAIIQKDFWNLV